MERIITTNLLEPKWLRCVQEPSELKGTLRNLLWENGWRDGMPVEFDVAGPIITILFDDLKE